MKSHFRQITALLVLGFINLTAMSAQETGQSGLVKTRIEAYKESLKNQKDSDNVRSMTASFTSGYDAELVESKLEDNACVELSQITINIVDGINQIGTFSNGIAGAGLQIEEGVVLSTGTITEMFTNNNAVLISEGTSDANAISDVDFDNLDPGGQSTHNESILILDFIVPPGLDGIRVPFQFASDEYPEYVGTQFNDVFGFFVSGPGFANSTNIALVPGTSIPIAVNSINGGVIVNENNANNYPASGTVHLDNSEYYIDNTDGTDAGPITGEYDGYSTLLYAEVGGLIPGETYQLKLGIADIADHYGDSGVYIGPLEGLYTGEPIIDCYCDINDPDLDCDKDGIINSIDCDPEDAMIAESGDACVDSNGDAGNIDENCICIASAGGISGGNSGGLESNNRLAQKIAKRNFDRKLRPDLIDQQKEKGEIPFKGQTNLNRGGELNLAQIIPTNMWGAYIADSTPTDLIGITNAIEVLSADYYINEVRSAVVLAIQSENGVYEHSKYICDRLDGASLLDVYYINTTKGRFIIYKIETATGLIEYATSFSGYELDGFFEIENHWNLDKYPFKDNYYNFQIWSSSIEKTKSLLITILANIDVQMTLGNVTTGTIPASFVKNGYYENGKLYINILNKGLVENLVFKGEYRESETAMLTTFETETLTNLTIEESLIIETGYLYDMGLSMIIDENHSDQLFIADGSWGYDDFNPNAEVLDFNIISQESIFDDSALGIERGIEISASVKDYQNVFRSLTPKWQSKNLSEFNKINFNASGNGMIQVTLVSDQETDWEKQLSYKLVLSEEMNEYQLALDEFENYNGIESLSRINMITITMIGNNTSFESMSLNLNDLNFNNTESTTAIKETDLVNGIEIFPNPASQSINFEFSELSDGYKQINIYNVTGLKIIEHNLKGVETSLKINLMDLNAGQYFLELIDSNGVKRIDRFIKK